MSRRTLACTVVLVLLLAACTGDDEPTAEPAEPTEPPQSAATDPSPAPEATEETEPTAEPVSRALDDRWYEDANDDHVPDFIATELGWDPEGDPCLAEVDCPGPIDATGGLDLAPRQENVLLVLDASGSMAGTAGGGVTKMQAAKDALERYVVGTPDIVEMGFMVYGHTGSPAAEDRAASCEGIELLAPLGEIDHDNVTETLARFDATGYTPLAGALAASRDAFADVEDGAVNRVIMVSDGIETCGGDPVAQARTLVESGIDVVIDVVGFDVPDAETAQLREIAEAGGGTYTDARTSDELSGYFDEQRELYSGLIEQRICLARANHGMTRCYRESNLAAAELMRSYADEADDTGQRDEILRMNSLRNRHYSEVGSTLSAAGVEEQQRLRESIEEAYDRMRDRYGEEVSAAFRCTLGIA